MTVKHLVPLKVVILPSTKILPSALLDKIANELPLLALSRNIVWFSKEKIRLPFVSCKNCILCSASYTKELYLDFNCSGNPAIFFPKARPDTPRHKSVFTVVQRLRPCMKGTSNEKTIYNIIYDYI
jgi:hypothetical protein